MKDIQKIKEFFSKPLNETTFKKGDKITYLGHPGVIKAVNKEMTGDITYTVSYDKGQGKTTASNISNKGGQIKLAEATISGDYGKMINQLHLATDQDTAENLISQARRMTMFLRAEVLDDLQKYRQSIGQGDLGIGLYPKERAAQDAQKAANQPKPLSPSGAKKLAALKQYRTQLMRDMEQEAEPEGGPIADKYGRELNKIDRAIAMLREAEEEETAVDMAKKQLDALGVKYEMSGNKFRPFKTIYKPNNKSNSFYKEFNRIVYEFNLESAVEQEISESLTAGYPHRKTSGEGFEKIVIVEPMDDATRERMIRRFEAAGWDAKPNNGGGITAIKKTLMNEIEYLNPGKRPIITNKQGQKFVIQGFTTSGYYLIPYDGKKYWEPSSVSKDKWIPEKDINWNDYNFSREQFNNLKAEKTEKEKEIIKKFQDMNEAKSEDSYEVVWTDRDYKKHSKVFKNDPKGAPDNAKKKAEAFKKSLEDKDKKSKEGLYRSIDLNEANGFTSGKQFINIKLKNYPKAVAKINQLINMIGEDRFTMEMAEWVWDFFNNASFESPVNEATKDEETEFHKKLDTLVHNTFGKRKGELEEVNLKQSKLSSAEYQKAKKLKDFKASDWKWNKDEDLYTKVNETELYEAKSFTIDSYSASDSDKITDFLTQNNISFKKVGPKIKISLDRDTPKASVILSKLNKLAKFDELNEAELTEAYVPSNIKEFAKRKGVSSLVNKIAGWAEKVGKSITGGTAIGYNYSTLILDMTYQGSEIRINTDNDTVELYGEPVNSFPQFKQVYLDNQEESDNGLEERIFEALNKINEELCPAGKAYIKRRKAAGEKSSAYLSGRAVKVCKGQMSGKAKKK